MIAVCDWSQATNRTTPDNLQAKLDNSEIFLDRFNQLSVQTGLSIVQCCKNAGISRSLFYEIRDGNRAVSDKVIRKLEQAERTAGIHAVAEPGPVGMAGSQAAPESSGEKPPGTEDPFSFQAQIDALKSQIQVSAFTLAELETRMVSARAWPASPSDRQLTPAQLWGKYAP